MSTANRILKNTGWLYAKMAITMFVSLYTTRLILNTLGTSDFGVYNIVGGAITMLGFLNAAMAGTTQRFINFLEGSGNAEKKKVVFNVSIVIHTVLAILVGMGLVATGIILFNGILNIPDGRRFASIIVYGSMIISTMFTIAAVPYDAILNSHENMKYYAFVGVVESILKLMVAFICVYSVFDKLALYGILMACIPLITLTVERFYCHSKYEECRIAIKKYWDKSVVKEMAGFAGWNLIATAVTMVSNSGVGIVMNMFFGTVVNAAQGVSQQICGQLMSVTSIMAKAVNPVITKTAGAGDVRRLHRMAFTSSKVFFFLCSLFAIPAIITMPEIMKIWLRNIPEYAVFFAQCQLIIVLCEQLVSGLNTTIVATGKIRNTYIAKSIIRIAYLPLIYYMFSIGLSPVSSYIALVVMHGIINQLCFSTFFAYKLTGADWKKYSSNVFIRSISVFLFVLFIGHVTAKAFYGIHQIMVVFPISMIIFTLLFYVFVFNNDEKNISKDALNRIVLFLHRNERR